MEQLDSYANPRRQLRPAIMRQPFVEGLDLLLDSLRTCQHHIRPTDPIKRSHKSPLLPELIINR